MFAKTIKYEQNKKDTLWILYMVDTLNIFAGITREVKLVIQVKILRLQWGRSLLQGCQRGTFSGHWHSTSLYHLLHRVLIDHDIIYMFRQR